MIGVPTKIRKMIVSAQEIGRWIKMSRFPPDTMNALRIFDSSSEARTKERIIGAVGYPAFARK